MPFSIRSVFSVVRNDFCDILTGRGVVERGLPLLLALVLLLSLSGLWARIAQADPPPPADSHSQDPPARLTHEGIEQLPGSTITAAMIKKRIEELKAATDLDQDTKTRLLGLYQKSLSNLEAISVSEDRAAVYARILETAPEQTREIRNRLETRDLEPDPEPLPAGLSVRELEHRAYQEADRYHRGRGPARRAGGGDRDLGPAPPPGA